MSRDQSLSCRRSYDDFIKSHSSSLRDFALVLSSRPRLLVDQDLATAQVFPYIFRREHGSYIPYAAMAVGLVAASGPANVPIRAPSPPRESRADPGTSLQA